jgi:hypothetical protein
MYRFTVIILTICLAACAHRYEKERFERFPAGSIKPSGWLKAQMQNDLDGFVGHLDQLVPDLINDPIYSSGRLGKNSKTKDLGNLKEGDLPGDDQYKWWNSETQSNWWDGYIRNALLLEDQSGIDKVKQYIDKVLASQDPDGYIGIYDKELRYHFNSENGELWSKATMYRGLLAYYEFTRDERVWDALIKAVDNVMENYPVNHSHPFESGNGFNGGVTHGLTFTDVLERLYQLTGKDKYREYSLFLYREFSGAVVSDKDAQLSNILDENYKFQSHGVHTYEHLRPLIVAAYASDDPELKVALSVYLSRIKEVTTMTGGPIGDEWIGGRTADATFTGYEYCSLHELLDGYALLLQKTGNSQFGDEIEKIFYNAAQGARNPKHSCIAYLKTDNSYEMTGTRNGETEAGKTQTRYKYSPAHQDVAVCCAPNAGRITPYFVQSSWMKEGKNTLVATLLMPNIIETEVSHTKLIIENKTHYPSDNHFTFIINAEHPVHLSIKIRKPEWVTDIETSEKYSIVDGYIKIEREFQKEDRIELNYKTGIRVIEDDKGEKYFAFGALIFARPIESQEIPGKIYMTGFSDFYYSPLDTIRYEFVENHDAEYRDGIISLHLRNHNTRQTEMVELIPLRNTILRQVSF